MGYPLRYQDLDKSDQITDALLPRKSRPENETSKINIEYKIIRSTTHTQKIERTTPFITIKADRKFDTLRSNYKHAV